MVAAALSRHDGRWLMHRRPPHKHHGGLWEFPGGKVEAHEVPVNALVRELKEELGIDCHSSDLKPAHFAQEQLNERSRDTVILLYILEDWHGSPSAMEEGAMVNWYLPEEIALLSRPPLDVQLCHALFG